MNDSDRPDHIRGKVIVVTGAASGFGRLISQKAASRGARVVCADIDPAGLDQTVASITEAGGTAAALVTDVTDLEAMQRLARFGVDRFGRLDVWVNNAGTMPLAFYADHAEAMPHWARCIDINFKGVLHGIVAAWDFMIEQGRGHVVNVSSIYGNFPVAGAGVYGATKAAVNFLSESLRVESRGRIKVTVVKPTGVPATGLSSGIVNREAVVGILGQNAPGYLQELQGYASGQLPDAQSDPASIGYLVLAPEHLADQVIHAIDQPWGVSIGDITVRASGDAYIL